MIAPGRVGRDGALRLRFERRGAATVLAACRSTLPLQVLAPVALDDPAAVVSLLNPTGGVLGGDRLAIDVEVGPGAHACLTTPSATRVYRAAAEPAEQRVRLALGAGAIGEWVPDHTIPSAGAALRQTLEVEAGEGAALIAVDAFAAGRVARGEAWRFALLDGTLTVRDARGLVLHDRFVLASGDRWGGLGFAEGHPYFATVVVVADTGLDDFVAGLPVALAAVGGATAAAARLPRRGALVRCLAAGAPALTQALETVWAFARRRVLGRPPLALRKL
ncbi:MAG TPA: urease accessory protein UreD [Methylomirabilota bacterium]|nr:urease accessory protein UreD [Methylomirabilota bacterium]